MKHFYLLSSRLSRYSGFLKQGILVAASAMLMALAVQWLNSNTGLEEENDMYDGPEQAALFEMERTKDPATGKVPRERLMKALAQTEMSQLKTGRLVAQSALTALSWSERGPDTDVVGVSNGNTRANSGVTSGRVRAMMLDSSDANKNTVWIGGVDGGLWKTTNISSNPATWVLVNDFLSNLAVSDICQDPTDNNIMYFCTGESYYNADAVAGVGVFKSTDHGVTWNLLSSTTLYKQCTRILCDYQGNIYLATRGYGLLRSTKASGGATWTNITPSTAPNSSICDLEISSTSGPGRLHMVTGIFNTQSYYYTDIPATVTASSGWNTPATPFPSYAQRAEIAVLGNTLYACPVNASYQVPTVYKSTDGGANWVSTATQPASGWASGQGWYSLSVGINPANPNQCIVGGLDNYKTTDGGLTWNKMSYWVGTTGQYVHADQHKVIWYGGGSRILFACDGGIHYSGDGGTTIRDRNVGLRLKQFYSVAIHPTTTNYFLAGAQDNGTHQLKNAGLGGSTEVTGGDGAFVAIDQDQPQYQFGAYVFNQYRRSTDGGNTWSSINFSSSAGQFINPFDYDNTANLLYAAHNAGQYLRWDNPQTGSTSSTVTIAAFGTSKVSAVSVSPYTSNRVYFGTAGGRVVQVDGANAATPTHTDLTKTGMPAGTVSCIATGTNDQNLLATYSNYGVSNIWLSTNGGTSWTACDGNLPDMPVRWILFYPGDNTKAYAATETGVWETDLLNGSSTVWVANPTFPTVRTDMIKYRSSDRTIAAGTHGRGIWTATVPTGCQAPSITSQPANAAICEGTNTSFTVAASGTATLTYQWKVSTDGGTTYSNLTNTGIYSGATTATLTLTGVPLSYHTYKYRCEVTGACSPSALSNGASLTVNANVVIGTVSGATSICAGTTTTFTQSGGSAGGAWSSSNTAVATVNSATGVVTGVTGGSATIRYTVSGCGGPLSASQSITINPNVLAGTVSGVAALCIGGTATYTASGTSGGSWSSSNTAVATVNAATGVVTAVSAGSANITYTVSSGCGSPVSAFKSITVNPNATAGTVNGTATLCVGGVATYTVSGATSGGSWSSSNTAVASVNASTGVVTALAVGSATITYSVTGCGGTVASTRILTVTTSGSAGTISGTSPICIGAGVTYTTSGTAGGTWSTSNAAVAAVNASTGLVTGVAAGTATITYSITGCSGTLTATKSVTVNANVSAGTVNGTSPLCIGGTATYSVTGATAGGSWSSSNTAVATVNATSGLVTAVAAGTANITYTVSGCGGPKTSSKTLTVNPNVNAGVVSGITPLCIGATTTYTSSGTPGGTWSSSKTSVATVNATTGLVTAVSAGSANITYTVTGCGGTKTATKSLTVSPNVTAGTVSGTSPLTAGATATYTKSGTAGGTWSSSNTSVATVNATSGLVTTLNAGSAVITYTVTGCGGTKTASKTLTVNPNAAGVVSGTSPICIGATTTYTKSGTSGGTWSSSNTAVATVNASSGLVTGVSAGNANIRYTVSGVSAFKTITISPSVTAGTVSGTAFLCVAGTTTCTVTGATAGGSWSSSNTAVATVNATSGLVTAVAAGSASISYTVTGCGGPKSASLALTVNNCPAQHISSGVANTFGTVQVIPGGKLDIQAYPNPSGSSFRVKLRTGSNDPVTLRIFQLSGKLVQEWRGSPQQLISLGEGWQPGLYIGELRQGREVVRFKLLKQ